MRSLPAPRSRSRLPLALLAVATLLGGAVVLAAPAGAYPGTQVDFEGHGWGHGRGLGQYGALGYAVDHGWSSARILDHYYGGTTAGLRGDSAIDVRLVAQDGRELIVTSPSAFSVGGLAYAAGTTARVRRISPSGEWEIMRGAGGCSAATWTSAAIVSAAQQPEASPAVFTTGSDLNQMLQVCPAGPGSARHYRGTVRILFADGATRTVNRVRMEQYLRGVVPRESPASWANLGGGRGAAAIQAQAVAARSYAWAEGRYTYAKTCDTTTCQVYGGAGLNGVLIEDARTDAAIAATGGVVRIRSGIVARTEFSSSTGGWTAGGTFPAVQDLGDAVASNPNHTWRASVPVTTVEARYPQIGALFSIDVTRRNGLGADGGRVVTVVIRGSDATVTVTGNALRSALGLKSDWFRVASPVLAQPAVGLESTATGLGYWLVARDGALFAFGDAGFHGAMAGRPLAQPVVGMASTPGGQGYWLVARDGGVFAFGDADFFGSTGAIRLHQPIVGMTATPSGRGYWFVAADGGVFAYGDARFFGSLGGTRLRQPVVGMASTPTGRGYWLVARDGGVFAYGDARFFGSTGAMTLNQPIVGMAARPTARGYWFVAADGGVFSYGDAPFLGSASSFGLRSPVVAMTPTVTGEGYRIAAADGSVHEFGDATTDGG